MREAEAWGFIWNLRTAHQSTLSTSRLCLLAQWCERGLKGSGKFEVEGC